MKNSSKHFWDEAFRHIVLKVTFFFVGIWLMSLDKFYVGMYLVSLQYMFFWNLSHIPITICTCTFVNYVHDSLMCIACNGCSHRLKTGV